MCGSVDVRKAPVISRQTSVEKNLHQHMWLSLPTEVGATLSHQPSAIDHHKRFAYSEN